MGQTETNATDVCQARDHLPPLICSGTFPFYTVIDGMWHSQWKYHALYVSCTSLRIVHFCVRTICRTMGNYVCQLIDVRFQSLRGLEMFIK